MWVFTDQHCPRHIKGKNNYTTKTMISDYIGHDEIRTLSANHHREWEIPSSN
ncbi:MAG TPA: hypothetical protein VJ729_04985 [Nitrososphaeraceae archaeon]|nr:hypothetical protein [Nitrososphaeraceae archaeon]